MKMRIYFTEFGEFKLLMYIFFLYENIWIECHELFQLADFSANGFIFKFPKMVENRMNIQQWNW